MLDFNIHNIGVYRYAQVTTWTNPYPLLGLHISGLVWRQRTGSPHIERDSPPHLQISGANLESSYEYGPDRENWVIQIDTKDIRNTEQLDTCQLKCAGNWVSLPARVYLNNKDRSHWQQHCQKLLHASRDASPRAQLFVRSGIASMINVFIEAAEKQQRKSPVEEFKHLIDEDEAFQRNLSEMAESCGYSADHMRILFTEQFGINPVQYRMRRRLTMAAELLANSRLSIAAIAERLGFQHSSHFCTAYKKHFGVSPGQDKKTLRL